MALRESAERGREKAMFRELRKSAAAKIQWSRECGRINTLITLTHTGYVIILSQPCDGADKAEKRLRDESSLPNATPAPYWWKSMKRHGFTHTAVL